MSSLSLASALGITVGWEECALAQSRIVPDNTLGAETSQVILNFNGLPVEVINGGAVRGVNLFHSFGEFNVAEGRGAYFFSPNTAIENILARVTGSNSSQILGTLGTFGNSNPNLFLINPNGIIFGSGASLDVGGSFVATTANAIAFNNQGFFNASAPNLPPLLTVNPSAFLFNQMATGTITNQSVEGLEVPEGRSLLLLGGDVSLDGAVVRARSGRIELGGVSDTATVGLKVNGNNLSLSFPNDIALANVSLSNQSKASVTGQRSGEIDLYGRYVTLTGGSQLVSNTGIEPGGNITVNASDVVEVSGESADHQIGSGLFAQAFGSGKGGDVIVNTRRLIASKGAQLSTVTFDEGRGGNLTVNASDSVELSDLSANGLFPSGLITTSVGAGTGGNLSINTGRLIVQDGAQVQAATLGEGQAGNVDVTATNAVEVSGILSNVITSTLGSGNAGNISINTRRLSIRDGGKVVASTEGKGQAGNLQVSASNSVEVSGTRADTLEPSVLSTETRSSGNAGDLSINTGQLIVRDGGQILTGTASGSTGRGGDLTVVASNSVQLSGLSTDGTYFSALTADTQGTGAAGNLKINTGQLIIQGGAQATTSTSGEGQGGNLTVNASDSVQLLGTTPDGQSASGLFTQTIGTGAAGNLSINTKRLIVRNGAGISTGTGLGSTGTGGNLTINASDAVEVSGTTANGQNPSGLTTLTQGAGKAGDLTISTKQLLVADGGQVSAATLNEGRGGNLTVTASDFVQVTGTDSGLFANARQAGDAGNLSIAAGELIVQDGAMVAVGSEESGRAGNLEVTARSISLDNKAELIAETQLGNGGDITLQVQDLLLMRHGSKISTTAGTAQAGGNGGNININANFIVAVPKEDSDITANAFQGRGGNINITTNGIYGLEFRPQLTPLSDITASSQFGLQGTVQINTPGVDPTRGLTNLPTNVADVSNQIAQTCPTGGGNVAQNQFIVTGRGGLPDNPSDTLSSDAVWTDWRNPSAVSSHRGEEPVAAKAVTPQPPIVEANGWVINDKGEVVLTAAVPTVTPYSPSWTPSQCHVSQTSRE